MTQFCIVLATQRTGTLGFGSGVEEAFDIKWLGEVFLSEQADPAVDIHADVDFTHKRATSPNLNFFNFRHDLFSREPALCYPSDDNLQAIYDRYLRFLSERVQRERMLIDIKYDSWHHLNGYWAMPPQKPHLVRMVQASGLPVIHILRDNYFAIYCSMRIAIESGMWHRFDDSKRKPIRIEIDLANCAFRMEAVRYNREWFRSMFAGYANCHEVRYEEMFAEGRLSEKVLETIDRVFGIEPEAAPPLSVRKTSPPLRETVSNRDEVIEYFTGTPYEAMVREALEG